MSQNDTPGNENPLMEDPKKSGRLFMMEGHEKIRGEITKHNRKNFPKIRSENVFRKPIDKCFLKLYT